MTPPVVQSLSPVSTHRSSGIVALVAAACLFVTGCVSDNKADALTPEAVDTALRATALDRVVIAAGKIDHPLLKPLIIDGRNGYSPDELALMAVIASPQLRALRDQRGVSDAQVLQAGILPNPQLGYSLDKLVGNNDPSLVSGKSLGLSWDLTSLLGRRDRIAQAKATAHALELDIAWQEWTTAQSARLNAFRLLSLQKRLPLVRQVETDSAETLAAIKQAVSFGQSTRVELTAATELWIAAQRNRFAAELEERTERSALNLALGLAGDYVLSLKPAALFPSLPESTTPESLLAGLEKRRLDLVGLTLGYESNEAALRAAVKKGFPRIGLSFAKANDTSDVRTHTYGVTVDIPLFDRNQGAIATAKATRQQLFDEYVVRVAEARAEVYLAFSNLTALEAQLKVTRESLPEWENLVASYEKALESRNADVAAYRDARSTLAARRLEDANLQQQLIELEVALEIATGRPLLNFNH